MDEDKITSQDGEQTTIRRNLLVHFEFLEPLGSVYTNNIV